MLASPFSKKLFKFLNNLNKNNNREWFNEHKSTYSAFQKDVADWANHVGLEMTKHDVIEKNKMFRIYRDVRFSKDKTPYKTAFSGSMSRATRALRGGYYWHVSNDDILVGGGFYAPNAADLKRIRQAIKVNPNELKKIINQKKFRATFGSLLGDEVKTAPRGYHVDDKGIELIKKKQYYVMRRFNRAQAMSPSFTKEVLITFKTLRPFFDYMSMVLTTDANGQSIL